MVFILIWGLILRFELKGLGRPGGMMPSSSKGFPHFPSCIGENLIEIFSCFRRYRTVWRRLILSLFRGEDPSTNRYGGLLVGRLVNNFEMVSHKKVYSSNLLAWMTLDDFRWQWMTLDDIGWHWMTLDDIGWHWMTLDDSYQVWNLQHPVIDIIRWHHMTSYVIRCFQITADDIKWYQMTSEDIRWYQKKSNKNR